MQEPTPAGALDVVPYLRCERVAFVHLLDSLSPEQWDLATECPAWSVKDIALHVLGDDFSLLSRQRDAATDGLTLLAEEEPGSDFRQLLDRFNERWVHQAGFFSPALVTQLLQVTGGLTANFYDSVDPWLLGEPVLFVGPDPAPYWMIAARECAERWIHHWQVARATSRSGPVEPDLAVPPIVALMRGFPAGMGLLPAGDGTSVCLTLGDKGPAWTLRKDVDTWTLFDGEPLHSTASVAMSFELASSLLSRGLDRESILRDVTVAGDGDLPSLLAEGLAAVFARSSA